MQKTYAGISRKDGEVLCYHCTILNIHNLTYLQGGMPLFQQVNLQAFTNQHIGLVGKNGCGKPTLFRLIHGELKTADVVPGAGQQLKLQQLAERG